MSKTKEFGALESEHLSGIFDFASRSTKPLYHTELTETEAELEQSFTEGKTPKPVSNLLLFSFGVVTAKETKHIFHFSLDHSFLV